MFALREDVENYCFLALLVSCAVATVAWFVGMLRRKPFGAMPAAVWVLLITVALLCAAIIGGIEFTR